MGLSRQAVYIANVVKCRPPGNRTPEPDEIAACGQFVQRQVAAIRPVVIVALGATAAKYLLGSEASIGSLRGRVHEWRGIPLVATYHPSYLLRNPAAKAAEWQDLRLAMSVLKR
jgi:DNA polymerase